MSNCRTIRGILASAPYEPPDHAEQQMLDGHLASCTACAAEYDRLHALVSTIPAEPIAYTGDMLPAVRERMRREEAVAARGSWVRIALPMAACIALFGSFVLVYSQKTPSNVGPVAELNPVERALAEAHQAAQTEDYSAALAVLEQARDRAVRDADAGRLQLAIANLEYDGFRRYKKAYDEYRQLREKYSSAWTQSDPRIKERFDLLTEAREKNYEALYQIDNARNQGEAGLPILERVMARYPGRVVAREALNNMVAMVGVEEGVSALEEVKARCTDPVALAQLDVHLGERYWRERLDPERGRALLQQVAGCEYEVPAKMAKDVLARLEE